MSVVPSPGDSRTLEVEELTRTAIVQYAGVSGDFSPLHIDEPAALAAGQQSVMGHGMLTMGHGARVLTEWFGPDSLLEIQVRFTAPVWPGDRLTACATVVGVSGPEAAPIANIDLKISSGDGVVVLSGTAKVRVEPRSAKVRGPQC